jgi:hypothetical protein
MKGSSMLFSFFSNNDGDSGFDHIVTRSVAMLADARHSFDLATMAVLTDTGADSVAHDIRETDHRINLTEQELRSELVVHVSVRGGADIGSVMGYTLLLKKIERIGDQAKNILELAEHGVSLADSPEIDSLLAGRQTVSSLFAEVGELLSANDVDLVAIADFSTRADAVAGEHGSKIEEFMTSELPGREVVPLAIYHRYLRRIVANLAGVLRDASDPIKRAAGFDGGAVDADD